MERSLLRKKTAVVPLIAVLAAALILPFLSGCFLSGCSVSLTGISFKQDTLTLNIGDEYTVTNSMINFEPTYATNKDITLSCDNEQVLSIDGKTIKALKAGSATVTAVALSDGFYGDELTATLTVNVNYADVKELFLSTSDDIVQYVGAVGPVEFHVSADVEYDPDSRFLWSVNGNYDYEADSSVFRFTPADKAGIYTVTVEMDGVTASNQVRVFTKEAESVSASYEGDTEQLNVYSAVTLTLSYSGVDGDPDPFIDWYVNGKLYTSGAESINFTPQSAGIYDIGVKVNNRTVLINGEEKLTVIAKGSVTPSNVAVTFDNIYPSVKVSWQCPHNEKMNYRIKIENLSSDTVDDTVSTANLSTRDLFDGMSADIGSKLDLSRASYRISVCSLGDGEIYTESPYSMTVTLRQLSSTAISNLEKKILGDTVDHYVTSDDELNELYAYYMSFRGASAKNVRFGMYMAYSPIYNVTTLVGNAFDYGASTGQYQYTVYVNGREIGGLFGSKKVSSGDTLTIDIDCYTTLSPTKVGGSDYEPLNVLEPHIAKNSQRTSAHVFEIEKIAARQTVSSSEELFRAAEYGVRPMPEVGSAAESLYRFARSLLIEIISDDMTDVEKVHAIYDWIMWNVRYDYGAVESDNARESAAFKAYWLEGVLVGARDEAFAVCDGMSKALALLCRMEGIPAYRVTGIAGPSVSGLSFSQAQNVKQSEWGGHAWNKVYVEDAWYVVDCTWGDSLVTLNNRTYEMAWHDWLLLSDADIADTHEYDHTTNNPTTAKESYNIYENTELEYTSSGGEKNTVDMYVNGIGSQMDAQISKLMDYLDWLKRNSTREMRVGNRVQTRTAVGVEIMAEQTNTLRSKATDVGLNNPFKWRLGVLGYRSYDYQIYTLSDRVLVMLSL